MLAVLGNSRVVNLRVADDSLVFMIKKFHLNVFPISNADRLMTAYDLGRTIEEIWGINQTVI
jgi:hypothetical protein